MPKSNSLAGNLTVLQENQQPYSNFNRLIVNLTGLSSKFNIRYESTAEFNEIMKTFPNFWGHRHRLGLAFVLDANVVRQHVFSDRLISSSVFDNEDEYHHHYSTRMCFREY